jgi:hypothetical protein
MSSSFCRVRFDLMAMAKKATSIISSVETHLFVPMSYLIVKGIRGRVK